MRSILAACTLGLAIVSTGSALAAQDSGPGSFDQGGKRPLQAPPGPQDDRFRIQLPEPPPVESPSRTLQLLPRASATTTVIRGADVQSLGARFLTDALRIAPGLEVMRLSSTESTVSARSYIDDSSSAQGILGLVDGRQVYNEFFGGVLWETLPVTLDDIERIEVIRGPGSFVHGPNALHGLVNIISKSPLDYKQDEIFVHGSGGSYRSNAETLTYVRRLGDAAGIKVKVAHDDIDEFEPRTQNAKDKTFMEVRFEGQLGANDHRLGVTAGASEQKFDVLIPTFAGLPPVKFFNEATEGFVKANYALAGLKAQASWTRFDAHAGPGQVYLPFDVLLDTVDLDLQYSLPLFEIHTVTAGTGYRYMTFVTDHSDVADGRHHAGLRWVFLQDEVELVSKALWLTAGVRLDDHSTAGQSTSPRLALVWKFDPGDPPDPNLPADKQPETGQYLRASAGYGFRNPSFRELWFDMPIQVGGATARVVGNKELKPEQMRSFEIGYWGRPTRRLQAELSLYYNLVDRLVEFDPVAFFPSPPFPPNTPSVLQPLNVNKDEAYGAELEVEYQVTRELFAFSNYAFEIRRDRETHERNPGAPRHKANGGSRLTYEGWSAMLWVTFFDDLKFIDPPTGASFGKAKEYALLNGQVSYHFKMDKVESRVFVQALNLLDHVHREHPQGDHYGLVLTGGLELRW